MLIHHRFICSVPDNTDFPAIQSNGTIITRKQLNIWSNHICEYLLVNGLQQQIIPIVAPKSIGCIAGMLGMLKAGCSFVLFENDDPRLADYPLILCSPTITIRHKRVCYMTKELLQNSYDGYLSRPVQNHDFCYRVVTKHGKRDVSHQQLINFLNDFRVVSGDRFHRNVIEDDWNGNVLASLYFGRTIDLTPTQKSKEKNASVEIISYGLSFIDSIFLRGQQVLNRPNVKLFVVDCNYKPLQCGRGTLVVEMERCRYYTKLICDIDTNHTVYYGIIPFLELTGSFIGRRFFME